jgi:hypothetical protein
MQDDEVIEPEEVEDPQDQDEPPAPPPETLAGGKLTLRVPTDIAERWDLYLASLQVPRVSYFRIYAAAIALCWPDFRKMLPKAGVHYNGDVVAYGGKVQAVLFSGRKPARERVVRADFIAAGAAAMALINEAIVQEEAVEAARDFT